MASLYKQTRIKASPELVWDALRDYGALHSRLAPGFVTDTRLEPGARIVTFANGMSVRELIVTVDDERRRLVWSVVGEPFVHHNGSAQVVPDGTDGCLFHWFSDLLPDEMAGQIAPMMEQGLAVIKAHLEKLGR